MSVNRGWFGICFDDAKKEVYVLGGFDNRYHNHCEKYSILTKEWIEIAPMNIKKMAASACIFDN